MADITAAAVKSLRDKTNLPMMECKQALQEVGGDEAAAIDLLRKKGKKTMESRAGRETTSGRITVFADPSSKAGAMIELQCESPSVATNTEFIQLANDLAKQLATGPGAKTPDELWSQKSPSTGGTLGDQKDDLANKIREVFNLRRIVRIDGSCGGYAHHTGTTGVLVQIEGGDPEVAKEVSMHIAAMRPAALSKEDIDPALVEKEREILSAAARQEGKPENIIAKMVEGRLRNYFSERVLLEQPFVKDDKRTVGQVAKDAKMKILKYVNWELGK